MGRNMDSWRAASEPVGQGYLAAGVSQSRPLRQGAGRSQKMANQFLILQAGVSAALAGYRRQVFERTDQDQFGQGTGLLNGSNHTAYPCAHRLHVGHDQFGKELSSVRSQTPHTAEIAYNLKLGMATKEMLNDAGQRRGTN